MILTGGLVGNKGKYHYTGIIFLRGLRVQWWPARFGGFRASTTYVVALCLRVRFMGSWVKGLGFITRVSQGSGLGFGFRVKLGFRV